MKRILLTFVLAAATASAFSQTVWDDFDSPGLVDYTYADGVFNPGFVNPSKDSVNATDTCARYARNSAVAYDVLLVEPQGTMADLTNYLDSTIKMSMKVFSPAAGLTVQITLENKNLTNGTNYPTGRHSEYFATTTVSNQWENLEFTLGAVPDPAVEDSNVNRMVILFEPNTNSANIFLFDSLVGPDFSDPCIDSTVNPAIMENFECQRNISYDFVNGDNVVVLNPMSDAVNSSENVGKITKWVDPDPSDSISVPNDGAFGGTLDNPFTSDQYKTVHISLYDPAAPQDFIVIMRDASETTLIERTFTTSQTNGWQDFKMDVSGVVTTTPIAGWVFVFNPATNTADSIFYDNFRVSNDSVPPVASIGDQQLASSVTVFPNPAQSIVNIASEQPMQEVTILNALGSVVATDKVNGFQYSKDIQHLSEGTYVVKITLYNGTAIHKKLLK